MKPGIYEYIDPALYHADLNGDGEPPTLSASIAHVLISRSPKHAWTQHPRLNPNYERKEDAKFDVGKACHQILLEGNTNIVVVPADDWRTKAAKEAREVARADKMTALLEREFTAALEMCEAVKQQLGADPFENGKPEVTLVWNEDNGVICRSRVDWLQNDNALIIDLKTTSRSARGEDWTRGALYDHGCDIQAAFYRRGVEALTGVRPDWRWIVVETAPPYALQVIAPGNDVLALGEAKVEKALRLWAECLERDEWPAYSSEVFEAEVPAIQEMRWMERSID